MTEHDDPTQADTLAAADRLSGSMQDLRSEMTYLRRYGHRSRILIWGLAVSLVLNLAVLAFVAIVAVQANDASSLGNQNKQSAFISCNAGNQARAVSAQLWTYVLGLTEQNAKEQGTLTSQAEKQIADFKTYISTAYAPRDCTPEGG